MRDFNSSAFIEGLGAFEGIMTAQEALGRRAADALPEVLSMVDMMRPGFSVAYEAYIEHRRNQVDTISIGNALVGHPDAVSWYTGPNTHLGTWPKYKRRLENKLFDDETTDVHAARVAMEAAVRDIDESTSRILSRCANPLEPGDRRKGLVIGYVQSGKTANYAGVIAKAVDAGYRLVIVLAGMYSNLRAQTQARLVKDLSMNSLEERGGRAWYPLTGLHADFADTENIGFLNNHANVGVVIIKKNTTRLANLLSFMKKISKNQPFTGGILIIDDESDQATPNTRHEKNEISAINKHVRDIWKLVNTGTYLAYTATPFANIFIDPSDAEDLYPEDFVVTLPRPDGYMGADTFFDLTQDADSPEELVDALARSVPHSDVDLIAVPSKDIDNYAPAMPQSLEDATRWFLLATAIRQLRTKKTEHSSMLIHTSHRVVVHERFKEMMQEFIRGIASNRDSHEKAFRTTFEEEARVTPTDSTETIPEWPSVWERTYDLIGRVKVVVDNGYSDDRLSYPDDNPQLVIAIGGGTLSRGLTLEGLVVSYFLRTSNTYDTLLQMGRWFGFRPHYADLVRIWATAGLLDDYRHLAQVERELRDEVAAMERENRVPREYALRVRSHPGRLSIVAPNKMSATRAVNVGLGGTRHQGTILDRSLGAITRRAEAATQLVREAATLGSGRFRRKPDRTDDAIVFTGVPTASVTKFLSSFSGAAEGDWLQASTVDAWVTRNRPTATWNVVLASGRSSETKTYDFGQEASVRVVKRAPLDAEGVGGWAPSEELLRASAPDADFVNIRGLMSGTDWVLDAEILTQQAGSDTRLADAFSALGADRSNERRVKEFRANNFADVGVLVLYAIDKGSQPDARGRRVAMNAPEHMVGVGIVYPTSTRKDDYNYFAVDLDPPVDPQLDGDGDEEEYRPLVDNEGDFESGIS